MKEQEWTIFTKYEKKSHSGACENVESANRHTSGNGGG